MRELIEQSHQLMHLKNVRSPHPLPALPHHRDRVATQKSEATKEEAYRSQYPGSLHFDYMWDKAKAKELGLEQIWRDDKFTYLRGKFQETPALYEVKDKKPSLINFDFDDGLYTVPKQLDNGYLEIGKQKVDFHRSEEGRYPPRPPPYPVRSFPAINKAICLNSNFKPKFPSSYS
jgi:hypothetical protein